MVSKGPREHEAYLGRGGCIFGAMWFLLSQLTSCLAPACQWRQEMLPLLPWFMLSHPLGKQGRGGGRRWVGSLLLPLEPSRQRNAPKGSKTWASYPPGTVTLGQAAAGSKPGGLGRGTKIMALWRLADRPHPPLEAAVTINYHLSRALRFPRWKMYQKECHDESVFMVLTFHPKHPSIMCLSPNLPSPWRHSLKAEKLSISIKWCWRGGRKGRGSSSPMILHFRWVNWLLHSPRPPGLKGGNYDEAKETEEGSLGCCCSVDQWYLTLGDPMDCSMPSFPVLHHLPGLAQMHVHWVSDAIQLSRALSLPSPPAFNPSQHQRLF